MRPLASSSVAAATRSKTVCGFAARPRAAGGFAGLVRRKRATTGFAAEAAIFDFFTNAIGPREISFEWGRAARMDRDARKRWYQTSP